MRFCLAGGESKKIYQIENGPNVLRQKENKKLHKKLIDKIILITVHKLNKKITTKLRLKNTQKNMIIFYLERGELYLQITHLSPANIIYVDKEWQLRSLLKPFKPVFRSRREGPAPPPPSIKQKKFWMIFSSFIPILINGYLKNTYLKGQCHENFFLTET